MVMNQGRNAEKGASGSKYFTIHYLLFTKNLYLCRRMNKSHKETISIRFISTAFMILAIAIFKPFGLEVGQWQSYLHLLSLFVLGLSSCFITEVILRFIVRMPAHQYAFGRPVYLSVSPLCDEQSGREQSALAEQLS